MPRYLNLAMICGNTLSDEVVANTTISSSRRYLSSLINENPHRPMMPPSTTNTKMSTAA